MDKNILIVEDQEIFQTLITEVLRPIGELTTVASASLAKEVLSKNKYDLILLDILLPDGDGLHFYDEIKRFEKTSGTPVIFLTGKGDLSSKLLAFKMGADDYLTKPFEPLELRARVERIFSKKSDNIDQINYENMRLTVSQMKAEVLVDHKWKKIDLTSKEFLILHLFVSNVNSVLSRQKILDYVWGNEVYITDRTVDSHVSNLRKKIKGISAVTIDSVRSYGYKMAA